MWTAMWRYEFSANIDIQSPGATTQQTVEGSDECVEMKTPYLK